MFWGCVVSESKPYLIPDYPAHLLLHITNVALSPTSAHGKTYLMITIGAKTLSIGYLQKDKAEMMSLDYYATNKQKAKLTVIGKGEVHFTGNFEKVNSTDDLDDVLRKNFIDEESEDIEKLPFDKDSKEMEDSELSNEEDMKEIDMLESEDDIDSQEQAEQANKHHKLSKKQKKSTMKHQKK